MTARPKPKGMEGITRRGGSYDVRVWLNGELTWLGSYPDPDAAKAARDTARAATRKGQAVATTAVRRLTVGEVAAEYLAAKAPTWGYRTNEVHASEWRSLAPTFAHVPVVALRPSHVQDWIDGQGHARRTVANRLSLLRMILDRPARDYGIPNAARLAAIAPKGRVTGPKVAPRKAHNPEAVAKVMATVADRYRVMVVLCLGLGLRSGEARGLTEDHVDLNTGAITVRRQLHRVKAGVVLPEGFDRLTDTAALGPLKTEQSYRVVKAGEAVRAVIREHTERFGVGPRGLLVTTTRGSGGGRGQGRAGGDRPTRPLSDSTWSAEVARIRETCGVDLRGHDLRHTYGSVAYANCGDMTKVAEDLGHSVETFARTYLHATEEEDHDRSDEVMDALGLGLARRTRAKGHLRAVG